MRLWSLFITISFLISSCNGLFESPADHGDRVSSWLDGLASHLYIDHAPILEGIDSVVISKETFGTFIEHGIKFIPNILEIDGQKVSVSDAYANSPEPYHFLYKSDTIVASPYERNTDPFSTNIIIQPTTSSAAHNIIIPLNMGGYILNLPPLDTIRYEDPKFFSFPSDFSHSLYIRPFATIDSNNNINVFQNITSSYNFGFDNTLDLSTLPYTLEEDTIFQLYVEERRSSGDIHAKNVQQNGKVSTIYYLHIKV